MPKQLTVGERLDVMELIADYASKLESGDLDGYVDNFTPDGVFEARSGCYEGRSAIRDMVAHLYEIGQDGPGGNRHILGLPYITGADEGCAAQTYVMIASGAGDAPVHSVAQYHDRIALSGGRWRFAHRRIEPVSARAEAR
ncbi:nuclear transport factor 2 family protein [Parasphingopyxis marina]|uniref:Nuclear transport factor 2 family protein n=1 Tax=Parasphingopyxis marina TaxID=2761622 RepID=A0A842HX81_9SPHN|nr:nuclear transport factor 2 family protein [Parasphingopyxis marina]MBC2777027.1 nuclear transport factor 2 family protein [Parasphingopyxis marina]